MLRGEEDVPHPKLRVSTHFAKKWGRGTDIGEGKQERG
jgi:hypothetical protein